MQSVYVYYVDLLNDMKTTVKTFWISMLLILTCSISGKAVDFAQIGVKSAEAVKLLLRCLHVHRPHLKKLNRKTQDLRISAIHGQQMLSWVPSLFLKFTLLTSSVYAE